MKTRAHYLSVALAALACSGATDTSDSATGPAAGFEQFKGTINDDSGGPLGGASVTIPYGVGQSWGGTTDNTGAFKFEARASDYNNVSPVLMVVFKARYLPRTFVFTRVVDGGTETLVTDASTGPRALAANEFVPDGAQSLWHIGDASFDGSANSQLQVGTSGTGLGFPIINWDATLAQQFHSATIQFVARGIQTGLCPGNRVGVFAENSTVSTSVPPSDSDPNGGFSGYHLIVPINNYPIGVRLMFGVQSGGCAAGDRDDWEFASVLVTLTP
ncbi:MAG: carboxypeptidase-like regulatory domain-containing protein [Gemmatimonadaceae bacterium]